MERGALGRPREHEQPPLRLEAGRLLHVQPDLRDLDRGTLPQVARRTGV